ncbi:hypothetical protein CEXT_790711 [Caerostris extrusa]|uniref:Uncharacterized protein n=1 Tax=Caerostris extrusa TaxID=172846 RepID=A0AAV4VUE2_CAEEX|nr:hypothetical protein CEXT_790711 [Caerostris extrusa]
MDLQGLPTFLSSLVFVLSFFLTVGWNVGVRKEGDAEPFLPCSLLMLVSVMYLVWHRLEITDNRGSTV